MSSLWTREPGELPSTAQVLAELELRHVPRIEPGRLRQSSGSSDPATFPLWSAFGDTGTSWMSSATVQLSLNGSEPSWSSNGWSFVPRDLSALSVSETQQQTCENGTACLSAQSVNVTMRTPAVRARLQCTPYDFLDDTPLWLTEWDLTDETYWNISGSPRTIDHGYELGYATYNVTDICSTSFPLDNHETLLKNAFSYGRGLLPGNMTPFFVDNDRLVCCQNSSSDNQIHSASIGYWSPNIGCGTLYTYPYISDTWPNNFTIKWIRGRPVEGYRRNTTSRLYGGNPDSDLRLIWAEQPQMTAMSCLPTIESANASVTVEAPSGRVISFRILDEPHPDAAAWSDNFAVHQYYPSSDLLHNMAGMANITVSYGVLFMTALLGAANIRNFEVNGKSLASQGTVSENLFDQAFNLRGPGLNVDYMSYAMLSLANGSHEALLDPVVLESTAKRTFEVMFQHFAHSDLDMESGGNVYQSPSESLPADIDGPSTTATSTTKTATSTTRTATSKTTTATSKTPTATSKARGRRQENSETASAAGVATNTTTATDIPDAARVDVRRQVEILRMSTIAAIICMSILAYLIITSVVLVIATRRYNKLLPVEINSVADVAVLVAGSERLLELARQRGSGHDKQLKSDPESLAKLGWFNGADGELRWGIELVEADNKTDPTEQRDT